VGLGGSWHSETPRKSLGIALAVGSGYGEGINFGVLEGATEGQGDFGGAGEVHGGYAKAARKLILAGASHKKGIYGLGKVQVEGLGRAGRNEKKPGSTGIYPSA